MVTDYGRPANAGGDAASEFREEDV